MTDATTATAFEQGRRLAHGELGQVALAVRARLAADPTAQPLVFDDTTGAVIDLDLRGSDDDVLARYAIEPPARGRGRPKLGVVAREVTLLPRQWDWLADQPGGASATLRRLIDAARRDAPDLRPAREAAYRFMAATAGDRPGFEEATRALFASDRERFRLHAAPWPADLREHAEALGWRDAD
jgi:hypothetical protein